MAGTHTEDRLAPVPPLRPDPEIMDNAEGNEKILEHDRSTAIAYLKDQDHARGETPASPETRAAG